MPKAVTSTAVYVVEDAQDADERYDGCRPKQVSAGLIPFILFQ